MVSSLQKKSTIFKKVLYLHTNINFGLSALFNRNFHSIFKLQIINLFQTVHGLSSAKFSEIAFSVGHLQEQIHDLFFLCARTQVGG
jgi:hypothetical protein